MEKFAGYGFNKSHSAAYALLSYQTAWLKTYYPAHFMAAVLSADMQNTDKVVILVEDCREMELPLILPNVNLSEFRFTVSPDNEVVYGLGAIKGLGEGPIESIVQAREEGGAFTDLFDFCARVDLRKVNRRALEALVRSGAMDKLGPHRALLMACLDEAIKTAEQHSKNHQSGMVDLFGNLPGATNGDSNQEVYANFNMIRPWTEKVRLQAEKETLGLYLEGHPFDEYETELRNIAKDKLVAIQPGKGLQMIAGLVVGLRTMKSKRGDTIAFVTLDDRSSRVEVSVFAEAYNTYREVLLKDTLLVIEGEIAYDDYSGSVKVRAKKVYDLDSARQHFARELVLALPTEKMNEQFNSQLSALLQPYRAEGCPVVLEYSNDQAKGRIKLGNDWRLRPGDDLLISLREKIGAENVRLAYR